ncbi:hypothetical protein JOB18_005015 [Solea senegalensis]|uniref:Uncharacterized protein n=1 Tax=Solea senegalensis TaxID=28829 RepID=A0AAV6QD20_SOLSE|nr:hypothetical protein JOB18_005015 [Solea senegalensis]
MEEQRVQTCDFYRTDPNLPFRFNNPDCFHGYSQTNNNPLYRTTNQTYGSKKPTVHEIQVRLGALLCRFIIIDEVAMTTVCSQTQYRGMSRKFSQAMLRSGMYCDHGFNTSADSSRVTAPMATQTKKSNLHYLHHHINQNKDQAENK